MFVKLHSFFIELIDMILFFCLVFASGNAAKAFRIRKGLKIVEKKYTVAGSYRFEAPSASVSTESPSSPHVHRLQQPQDAPVRTGESESTDQEKYGNDETTDNYKDKSMVAIDEGLDQMEEGVTPCMEAVSPNDSHKIEELGQSSSFLSPVKFKECAFESPLSESWA